MKRAPTYWKHGKTQTEEFKIWSQMRYRCLNPKSPDYHKYGARGITVCARWSDFTKFLKDVGPRPGKEFTLERLDNSGDYEPRNVRWATHKEQQNNTNWNHRLTFKGETHSVAQWSEKLEMNYHTLWNRIKRGWPYSRALSQPVQEKKHAPVA